MKPAQQRDCGKCHLPCAGTCLRDNKPSWRYEETTQASMQKITKQRQSPQADTGGIKKILVCQLRQIGDVLLATPSVELLARHFPDAEIHFFVEEKCVSMLENNPHIHKIWPVQKKSFLHFKEEIAYYKSLADEGFDLVVDFQQLPRIRWVLAMSRARLRLSFPPKWYNRLLYTHWTQPEPQYAAAFKAAVLQPLGIAWQGERPKLYLTEAEQAEARALLYQWGVITTEHTLVTLDVTHRRVTRRWPKEYYATLIDAMAEAYPQARFLLPYGPGEGGAVEELRALCAKRESVIVPQTLLSLRQMAACMEHAALHIGNCSAPRHMAVAMGTPTITFLGATSTGWTFPSAEHLDLQTGLSCQPCNKNTCPDNVRCLVELTPEKVIPHVLDHAKKQTALGKSSQSAG